MPSVQSRAARLQHDFFEVNRHQVRRVRLFSPEGLLLGRLSDVLGRFTWPDGSKYEAPTHLKHCEGYQPLAGRTIRWKAEWPEP